MVSQAKRQVNRFCRFAKTFRSYKVQFGFQFIGWKKRKKKAEDGDEERIPHSENLDIDSGSVDIINNWIFRIF